MVLSLGIKSIIDSRLLCDEYGISIHDASTLLRHYYRQGLFNRWRESKAFYYQLTERGYNRYWYLLRRARCRIRKPVLDWNTIAQMRCPVKDLGIPEIEASLDWLNIQRCYIGPASAPG